jgi:ribose transport system permease protein
MSEGRYQLMAASMPDASQTDPGATAAELGRASSAEVTVAGGDRLAVLRRFASGFTKYGIVVSCLGLFVALTLLSGSFLTQSNLTNVLEQNAPVGIMAVTLTVVMLGGDLDFSVGAIYGFAGVLAAQTDSALGSWPALGLGVLAGLVIGLSNGLIVAYGRVDSFIATLASGIIVAGLSLVVTGGSLVTATGTQFGQLGNGTVFGLQYDAWIFLVAGGLLTFLMTRSRAGRYVYATGDNPEAARLSGIPTQAVRAGAFVLAGGGAALAGVMVASQTSQGQPQDGLDLVVNAIAAVVVGGSSVGGGRGAVWRTVLGVLFLAMIANGLNLLTVSSIYQEILYGGIILGAVLIDRISRGREQ